MGKVVKLRKRASSALADRLGRELSSEQAQAALAPDGYNLILAGPGSGKTRVMIYRVAALIDRGVRPESILLVTFTRRAAREMVGRLEALIGPAGTAVWAGTFHHVANRLLRRPDHAQTLGLDPGFTILDSEDQRDLMNSALAEAGLTGKEAPKFAPKPPKVLGLYSQARNTESPLARILEEQAPALVDLLEPVERSSQIYERLKRAANSVDYDDLLVYWLRALRDHPPLQRWQAETFQHLLVDEMQDTNALQGAIVETIAQAGSGNLTVVGDDAQSIYRFRGANYDNILKFPDRNPGARTFRLETNYRSTPEIVDVVNAAIAPNQTGFPKTLVAHTPPSGSKPWLVPTADAYEEAEFVCQQILTLRDEENLDFSQMAVMYRNHFDSMLLQGELVNQGIPYTIRSGLRFFEQAHVKDVLAYLRILTNPRDEPAWKRLLQLWPGIGPAKANALCAHLVAAQDPLSALRTAETMALVPTKARGHFAGFVSDLDRVRRTEPETHPAQAIQAVLEGGYPSTMRTRYENPDGRREDLDQLALLAGRYESLERMVADLLLAGDVYGADTLGADEPQDLLSLTTVHQAKGLEWSRVFVIRLNDETFPNARALSEPEGLEEERRIFYVAVSRAQHELYLSYPLIVSRGRGQTTIGHPSRFLQDLDPELLEPIALESDNDLAWTGA